MRALSFTGVLLGAGVAIAMGMVESPAARSADAPLVHRLGEMTAERAAHQATRLPSGRVLITGGCAGDGCTPFHRSTEIYDPTSRAFRPTAPMSIPRASHTATLLQDGRVLVAGGCSDRGATASAEVYDEEVEGWTPVGEMTKVRCSHIAVPLTDGRVFIMGGGSGRLGDFGTAEIFDPATLTFSSLGGMRANHYLATRLPDGRVLLTGGQGEGGEILATAELFDPASHSFEATGDMMTARVKHAAVALADGRVLVIGGSDRRGYDGRFNSTEIYDPATGTFSPGPELHYGRHKIRDAVAVLPSGAIIVAGGAVRPELFDPADRVFVPARGELGGPQMFATASVLESGDVLVLGGYDERTRPAADAWVITETGTSPLEVGRQLTQAFMAGDLEPLWDRMTLDMRDAAGGSISEFEGFRERVADLVGEEVEVLDEEVLHEQEVDIYRRHSVFNKAEELMVVQWAVTRGGAIEEFFIRPAEPAAAVVYETKTELHLPFVGEWYVTAGGRTVERNHHSLDYSNRFAYDLVRADEFGRSQPRLLNEHFTTWGEPILAPAPGTVAAVRSSVPDNAPEEVNDDSSVPMGNFVSIDHGNGEFSVLGHLQQGTVRVTVGDRIRRGEVVGLAGNSGNSDGPHLHFNLQDRAEPNRGKSLPAQFVSLVVDGQLVGRGEPVQGQRIRTP